MLKNLFKVAVIAVAGLLLLGSGYAQAETLPEAIQQTLVTHPDIKAAAFGRQARDEEVVQARGPYFPTLDGSISRGYEHLDRRDVPPPPIVDPNTWPSQSRVSLRQNVFRGGANYYDVRRQQERVRSQAYLLQGTSENIALLTARVYMNVLRSTELSELARENLANHERIGDQVKLRMQSGVDRRADLDQVMGRLALAQSNVVVTAANLRDARTDYQAVVGRLPEALANVEPLKVTFPATLGDAEQFALKNYPIVKSAKSDLAARKAQYEVAKRLLSPSVDLAADYNWQDDISPNPGKRDFFSASAIVSFNFFNGLRDHGRIRETMYLVSEAEEILNNTQRQTIQSIRLSWEAYQAASERVTYLEDYAKATEATAAAFTAQWNIGRRTMFDLLDTQAEAINAKSDLVRARYDKYYAEYRILSGMGTLVHSLGLQWPEQSRIEGETAEASAPVAPAAAAAPPATPQSTGATPDGFMKADKDGFIRSGSGAAVAPPAPTAAAPQAVQPLQQPAAAPPAAEPVKQVPPAAPQSSGVTPDGFMKADKDGFIRSGSDAAVAPPAPAAAAPQAVQPVQQPAAAPRVAEPVKQVPPAAPQSSGATSDGFMKADKDGFIKAR